MCGIAGVIDLSGNRPPDLDLLRRMAGALRHRGPDEFGVYRDVRAGLAHARLSIIDLAGGQQPMANEDGTVRVAFNGEIFNYVELREELREAGHRFATASDTEVLVHGWEAWGPDLPTRLRGQFAFAIWDSARATLFLARDRVGIRPLYHAEVEGRIHFASEVKAIFADPRVPRRFDPEGIDQVFTFWTTVAPTTPFEGVRELPPGTTLTVEIARGGSPRTRTARYWEPRFPEDGAPHALSVTDAAAALLDKLEEATRLRMIRSDVPVGSYLSGGIDSSVIAALGRRATDGEFRTFSIRFADEEFDETAFQRMMVERLGSSHAEILCRRADIARVFPDVIRFTERPVLRTAPAPLYALSGLVREAGFKVVLTGEGSDEVLAGYDLFREDKVRRFWSRAPESPCRPLLLERLYPYLARSPVSARAMARKFFGQGLDRSAAPDFSHAPRWSSASALKRLFSEDLRASVAGIDAVARLVSNLPEAFPSWAPLARAQYLEMTTLLSGYLLSSQGDRMLMAHSVEGRFPFLDHHVVEFCNGLPPSYKLRVLDEKHLLKRAAAGLIPDAILRRPKQPYRAPDAPSFVGAGAPDYVEDLMGSARIAEAGLFEPGSVERLIAKCAGRAAAGQLSNADNMAFLGVLSTQILWWTMIRNSPTADAPPADRMRTVVDRISGDPGDFESA